MLNRPEPACLVIADISGYTGYLAAAELDHAQDVLADLISTVVGALRPMFRLAKLEGDAAFTYLLGETLDGSSLLDTIETCYETFRRRVRDIERASRCDCNACVLIPKLDLKVVAHHGTVVRQRILGREELTGADVVIAHRLLKNTIVADLGVEAYAAYTEACITAMGIADPAAVGLVAHDEPIEHLGTVRVWVADLDAAWRRRAAATHVVVEAADATWSIETFLPAPPPIAWEWMTSPARRPTWQDGVIAVTEASATGRRGVGTTNHCVHGRNAASIEEILDWRPYDVITIRFQMPIPGAPKLLITDTFEPVEGGTRHTSRIGRPRSIRDRAFLTVLMPLIEKSMRAGMADLVPKIAADVANRSAGADVPVEPPLPVSARRFESAPIVILSNRDGPGRGAIDGGVQPAG